MRSQVGTACALLWTAVLVLTNAESARGRVRHPHSEFHSRHSQDRIYTGRDSCVTIDVINATAGPITIQHCNEQHIYIFETSATVQPSFLVRVVGPQTIFTGLSEPVVNGTHMFQYSTPHLGPYRAFIKLLMEDVPDDNVKDACTSTAPTLHHEFQVDNSIMLTHDHSHFCCWETNKTFETNWMQFENVLHDVDMTQRYSDIFFNFPVLSKDTLSQCFVDAVACIFGDSQMRNLHVSIKKLKYNDTSVHSEMNFKYHANTNVTSVFPGLKTQYIFMPTPNMTATIAPEFNHCTHSFYNFGHWPLGFPEGYPWSFQKLEEELDSFLNVMKQRPGLHYWVSTPPHPMTDLQSTCPPTDWRILTHINTFNERAKSMIVSKHPTVAYVDTFRPMLHMHDFSFDKSHYQEPVGPSIARYVLSTACPGYGALRRDVP